MRNMHRLILIIALLLMPGVAWAADAYYSFRPAGTGDLKVAATVGVSSGVMTFSAGQTGDVGVGCKVLYNPTSISSFGNRPGDVVRVTTSAAHNFTSNDYVEITGTTNYNGTYLITVVSSTIYDIPHTWDGDDATGTNNNVAYISAYTSTTTCNVVGLRGETPNDISSGKTLTSINHEYASASALEAGVYDVNHLGAYDKTAVTSLVSAGVVLKAAHYSATADTTQCYWYDATTGASNWIEVFTPRGQGSNESYNRWRHEGKWSTSYAHCDQASSAPYRTGGNSRHTRFIGLQLDAGTCTSGAIQEAVVDDIRVSHTIFRGDATTANASGWMIDGVNAAGTVRIWNCLFFDWSGTGSYGLVVNDADATVYTHNNTVVDCKTGIRLINVSAWTLYNNISDCGAVSGGDFVGDFSGQTYDYNFSVDGDATNPSGANGKNNASLSYVAEGSDDFHLDTGSTDGIDCGKNLYSDANCPVVDDVDGDARPTSGDTFEIGFDEHAAAPPAGQPYLLRIPRMFPQPFGRRQYR